MKYKKVLLFTVSNSLALLTFASFLSSCQEKAIRKSGHFGSLSTQLASRSIASTKTLEQRFEKHQDPKQIFIYCSLNSLKKRHCYSSWLRKSVYEFNKKSGPFKKDEVAKLTDSFTFDNTETKVKELADVILKQNAAGISNLVMKRKNFCIENAKYLMRRCLRQYIQKDTHTVLNGYQIKNPKINGPEYLYIKKIIEQNFKLKFTEVEEMLKTQSSSQEV